MGGCCRKSSVHVRLVAIHCLKGYVNKISITSKNVIKNKIKAKRTVEASLNEQYVSERDDSDCGFLLCARSSIQGLFDQHIFDHTDVVSSSHHIERKVASTIYSPLHKVRPGYHHDGPLPVPQSGSGCTSLVSASRGTATASPYAMNAARRTTILNFMSIRCNRLSVLSTDKDGGRNHLTGEKEERSNIYCA